MSNEGIVSEYPLPPNYYKEFPTEDDNSSYPLQPPSLEGAENLQNICYGSVIQTQHSTYNERTNYKEELKSCVTNLF